MGVFNIFVVLPQMVAALILGFFVQRFFDGQSIYALVVGGVSMVIAGLMNLIIKERKEDRPTEIIEEVMTAEQRPI